KPGAGLGDVKGSLLTTGERNLIGIVDPVTGNQMVQVRNPTEQAVEFEWRDSRTSVHTVYASGTVGSGEALFLSITDSVGGPPTSVLFVKPVGGGEFAPRPSGQGTVAGPASATQDFVVGDNTPAPGTGTGTGTGTGSTDFTPVTAAGQLSFDPGADGARITALTVTALSTWTAAGKPVVFAQTPTTDPDGTLAGFITLTGTAAGTAVLTVEVNTATGDYEVTLLAPLDHPPAAAGMGTGAGAGTAPPLKLELGYTVTDVDGDQATGTAEIQVLDNGGGVTPPPPPPPPLEGAVQVAEAATQDFTGTAGADVFRWTLAESIDPSIALDPTTGELPPDTIGEFGLSGTDVLDLSDLLDQPGSAVLVEENGDNTEVTVTGTKGGDAFSQTIVLINFQDGASGNAIKTALDNDGFYKSQEP
nr:DUF5801 domain-containing protein [Serpentinimonas sp.]